ncbi:MAG: hypothetical protein COV99_07910 [Bacteroidetes bacterium CG12_big_fil_rev_8_21_14_0_65_60_17]|nr:MAG: hypothetical protein COV99_07910 [Bacteroidetes bacterium CG12_big_fil_rev_8_21_14_0_65_60_17]
MQAHTLILSTLVAILVSLFLVGCEENVSPVVPTERVFTMWGFLDPTVTGQKARVFRIEPVLEPTRPEPLGATMAVTDVASGQMTVWRDSLILFPDGFYGHVYQASQEIGFDREYLVELETPEGLASSVLVRTPPETSPELSEIQNVRFNVKFRVRWNRAPQLLDLKVRYHVGFRSRGSSGAFTSGVVTLQTGAVETASDGTPVTLIEPTADLGTILQMLNLQAGRDEMTLDSITVAPFVASDEWRSPTGSFDAEVLVQPGTLSNVENGFGFFGAGFEDAFVVHLPDDAVENAGFTIR